MNDPALIDRRTGVAVDGDGGWSRRRERLFCFGAGVGDPVVDRWHRSAFAVDGR